MPETQDDGHEAKRRKVRKGTQSCWECKRRKVRCIFASPDTICNNCQRRKTTCISQELPDISVSSLVGDHIEDRLNGVEKTNNRPGSVGHQETPTGAIPTANPRKRAICKYEELSRELLAAWPSADDLAHMCTLSNGPTMRFLNLGILPSESPVLKDQAQLTPQDILQLPPPGSHPIFIAAKLLMLGTFIQEIPPRTIKELGSKGASYLGIMNQAVDKAIRLVTTNDELICSVEAIDCIMMEAIYQNHSGNLHRAWMAVHRATAVAQMMAIHRGLKSPSLRFLSPATRDVFDPDQICFRLIQMDRYLCIMLGLPPTSLEARFTSLDKCSPIDRLERTHCIVSERILRRSEADLNDLSKIYEDDKLLQKIASEMPPQWWLSSYTTNNGDQLEVLEDTVRLVDQFAHYHLLIRLHLPYILRPSTDHKFDHSKITAINASREILARYLAFRSASCVYFYCRGDEFLVFISITVMCIAHMNSHKQLQQSNDTSNGAVFNFLAHSRPSDRGMMERTLEIIESTAQGGADAITSKLAMIIRQLLIIEANAANGTIYNTSSSNNDDGELACNGRLVDGDKVLHVYIPYFGKINFERRAVQSLKPNTISSARPATTNSDPNNEINKAIPNGLVSNTLQQSDSQYPSGDQISEVLALHQPPSPMSNESPAEVGDCTSTSSYPHLDSSTLEEFWDMQGIDTALFDSLFRGVEQPFLDTEENWVQWDM